MKTMQHEAKKKKKEEDGRASHHHGLPVAALFAFGRSVFLCSVSALVRFLCDFTI